MTQPPRKNNRLIGWDYSKESTYFVTICAIERKNLFGRTPVNSDIFTKSLPILSNCGIIIETSIKTISKHYPNASVDKYVVMPNHLHLLIRLSQEDMIRSVSISTIVNQLKGHVTKQLGEQVWQKSFYDHIIRDEEDYMRIYEYIDENPAKWSQDKYYIE